MQCKLLTLIYYFCFYLFSERTDSEIVKMQKLNEC